MKKFLAVGVGFVMCIISFGLASSSDKNNNSIISLGDGYVALQNGTSAAYTLYLTSSPASGVLTGKRTIHTSTMTLEILNSLGNSATYYFDLSKSTSDSINDIIAQVNLTNYWTASIVQGCYGDQTSYSVRLGTPAVANEGYILGLQNSDDTNGRGKVTTLSTGSANAITNYLNGTLYITQKFVPVRYQEYAIQTISCNLGSGTTMYVYEGNISTCATTLLDIPKIDLKEFNYPTGIPLPISNQKYFEYVVKYGTYTVCSGDSMNRTAIYYYKFKR